MPPRKHRQRASGAEPGGDAAGPGPSSQAAALLDALLAHAAGDRGTIRALRQLCRRARDWVDAVAISALDLAPEQRDDQRDSSPQLDSSQRDGKLDHAAVCSLVVRLPGLRELKAPFDAVLLGQVAAARAGTAAHAPLRSITLHLPQGDTELGPDLGTVLAALSPGLEVRVPRVRCAWGPALGCRSQELEDEWGNVGPAQPLALAPCPSAHLPTSSPVPSPLVLLLTLEAARSELAHPDLLPP
jgi:hypothetical protein